MFGSSEISFPGFVRDALDFALEHGPFAVRDLPQLDDEEKLVLVGRLLKEGIARAPKWIVIMPLLCML